MIRLKLAADRPQVQGFAHLWAKYVTGFNPAVHCLPCLIGLRSSQISRTMASDGHWLDMNETAAFDYLYICGVTRNWSTNFHFVLRPRAGTATSDETHNGYRFTAHGAERVDIPWLADGWAGLPMAYTSCRNYQFGVAFYSAGSSDNPAA